MYSRNCVDSPPAPSLPSSLTSHPTPFGPFLRDYSDSLLASQYLSEQELLRTALPKREWAVKEKKVVSIHGER